MWSSRVLREWAGCASYRRPTRFYKIRPLARVGKGPGTKPDSLRFHSHLPCAGEQLPSDPKRQRPPPARKGQRARNQIAVVAAITVTVKVGIIFVELNMHPEPLIATICRALHDAPPPGQRAPGGLFECVRHSGSEYRGVWSL